MQRSLPPLNALRAFEAAARHLNFTRAAEELGVTQTAVSHHVKLLEERLGFRLFRRLNNALILTEKGEAYLPGIREAFDLLLETTQTLCGGDEIRTLSISVLPNFALRWLIPRLRDFQVRHPQLDVRIFTSYRETDFLREDVDVAIRLGDDWPGLNCDYLFSSEIFPVCSAALLTDRPLRSAADLAAHTLLHVFTSPDDWSLWLTAAGAPEIPTNRGPKFDSYALALEAAVHGCGIAMGRTAFVQADLEARRLVAPFPLRLRRSQAWYFLWPKGHVSPKTTLFRAWILRQAARTRDPDEGSAMPPVGTHAATLTEARDPRSQRKMAHRSHGGRMRCE
jgi:LysR family transcriptional regulator, glycine cleavage system transcriptional activator